MGQKICSIFSHIFERELDDIEDEVDFQVIVEDTPVRQVRKNNVMLELCTNFSDVLGAISNTAATLTRVI